MSRPEFWMTNRDMPWRRIKPLAYESLLNWIEHSPAEAEAVGLRVAERHDTPGGYLQHAMDLTPPFVIPPFEDVPPEAQ